MDYFSAFIQTLHTRRFSDNTIRVYSTYVKPYLSYLDKPHILPEDASYQTMRDYLDWIQSERRLSDRTINMIISYLQFFQTFVLTKVNFVGLSNICYTPINKFPQNSLW